MLSVVWIPLVSAKCAGLCRLADCGYVFDGNFVEGGYAAGGGYDAGGGRGDRRRTDLGLLKDVVLISFLNFSLGVFALCVLLMVVASTGSAVKQGGEATVAILVAVGGLWVHFS